MNLSVLGLVYNKKCGHTEKNKLEFKKTIVKNTKEQKILYTLNTKLSCENI